MLIRTETELIKTEREQQLNMTFNWLRALELKSQAGSAAKPLTSLPALPCDPVPGCRTGLWLPLIHLAFHFDFAAEAVEQLIPFSLLQLLRQLPTYQIVELISLELLASNQEPDSKNILELFKKESVTNKIRSWIQRAPSQSVLTSL